MTPDFAIFWMMCAVVAMLLVAGIYCLFMTYNLIRILIGIEMLIKAVTLLVITAGFINSHIALAQAIVITLIVVEVVFIVVATGVVIGLHTYYDSLDTKNLKNLKG
jgi:NADH:ubiquinone oxidoreductase subunit K